jgi:uncharacterized protein YbjQ (UPF0145 family)
MQQDLDHARDFARTMSDQELVEETSRSLDALSHAGWQAIHEEVSRRGLRVKPWRNESFILVTTVNRVSGYAVHQTVDVVAAEYVLALSFVRDLGAGVTDVVDGRSTTAQEELREARRVILSELREQARIAGADAVIDVRFSYGEVPGPGKRLLMVAGVGTAVQMTRLPGAPIRDVAGDALPATRRSAADLATRAEYHHPPRFPGITDSKHR